MNQQQLFEQIQKKRSFLCVGLDTDILLIPKHLLDTSDPIFSFNKEIFKGTEGGNYYKVLAQGYDPLGWTHPYEDNWYKTYLGPGISHPMPYPFPLEDMNLILDTEIEAWSVGKFCVGAIGVEEHPGVYAYAEFDNQTDIVAATGVLDLLRRTE